MNDSYKLKADLLTDALPYMQDFEGKTMVIQYSCNNIATPEEEKRIMQDIALLHFVGVHPIVVHSSKKGTDIFRENKRIAALLETNNLKAIGICGIDLQTINILIDNQYIPVIMPNDIQTEDENILAEDVARKIAVELKADKLIFMSKDKGLLDDDGNLIPIMSLDNLIEYNKNHEQKGFLDLKVQNAIKAINGGVHRVHIIDGLAEHSILVELFSVKGIGTAILDSLDNLYKHEIDNS
ncbi:acetylglutamate kinase [uncultured Thomasclavelia sp.]|uniref:acetylglutamate kinase n=1 Tax=uncultured Thomasclavelia sp. TaxID=3025759 RepID=UPI002600E82A|nr:acetylglutamate kinase [uncultured Thomasclavelia sp.]